MNNGYRPDFFSHLQAKNCFPAEIKNKSEFLCFCKNKSCESKKEYGNFQYCAYPYREELSELKTQTTRIISDETDD